MERFWENVDIQGENDCWPWKGSTTYNGYGRFWLNGKTIRANRLALSLTKGEPECAEMLSLHSCDNPPCCNPSHLRWGTEQDNSDDMVLRKRASFGERSGRAMITDEQASTVMRMRVDGFKVDEIAEITGVSRHIVMNVYTGSAWSHLHGVDGNPTLANLKASRPKNRRAAPNRVLTDEMVDRIFSGRMKGMTARQIAEDLSIPLGTVSPVFSGLSFSSRLGKFGNPTKEQLLSVRTPPASKLTEDDIIEIKKLLAGGFSGKSIAAKFGVSAANISRINTSLKRGG